MERGRRYSIGRGTRVRHSTAMEWDEWKKANRKSPVRYSTSEDGRIRHSTGRAFDQKLKEQS